MFFLSIKFQKIKRGVQNIIKTLLRRVCAFIFIRLYGLMRGSLKFGLKK